MWGDCKSTDRRDSLDFGVLQKDLYKGQFFLLHMIKTLIFDFAGVITTSALFPRVADVLSKKFGIDKEEFYKTLKSQEKEYLLGNCTTRDFWQNVCQDTQISYDDFVREISWYKINEEVLNLLRNLKGKYELVLLSDNYDALFQAISNDKRLQGIFDYSFYSHQLHMVKVYDEEKIFNHVLKSIKIGPDNCVFIDDKEINLASARKLGIHTILFKDIIQLKKELAAFSVNVD